MPATVVPINARRRGTYVLPEAALPGRLPLNIGVLLIDPATDRGWVRMRARYHDLAGSEDAEVLEALEEDIRRKLTETGAEAYLRSLEDSLSNALGVSERQSVAVDAFSRVVDHLYDEHVEKLAVEPFRTHVPLYSLKAAAGGLGEEMLSEVEDWVRAPEGMRLDPYLFVAHVVGDSMEPRIPNGSLNLFRFHPAGSRQNKFLLIERFGVLDETARYTVKKYTSRKVFTGEDQWHHEQIRLVPLNPEHQPWDAEPTEFAVVAEWICVIE